MTYRKIFFVNGTLQAWSQLPADSLWTVSCEPSHFMKSVRKVMNELKRKFDGNHKGKQWSESNACVGKCHKGHMKCECSKQFVILRTSLLLQLSIQCSPQRTYKWPNSKPHWGTRQQAIAETPIKWSAYQIPSVIVVFVILIFKV
jgi:hypothetical protein